MSSNGSYTGRTRRRETRPSVRVADRIARGLITVGGLGTIAAVTLVCVFLASVVVPLFLPSRMQQVEVVDLREPATSAALRHLEVDEYRILGWMLYADGRLEVRRLKDGHLLHQGPLVSGAPPTALSVSATGGDVAMGFADGTIRFGSIRFTYTFLDVDTLPEHLRAFPAEDTPLYEDGLLHRSVDGPIRLQRTVVDVADPISLGTDEPVILIDQSIRMSGYVTAALTREGRLFVNSVTPRRNLMTGQVTYTLAGGTRSLTGEVPSGPPLLLAISEVGDNVFLVWPDGTLVRYDTRDIDRPVPVERVNLIPEADAHLTATLFLLGKGTLITGDSAGRVRAHFRMRPHDTDTADGSTLATIRQMPSLEGTTAVTALARSARTRMLAAGFEDGSLGLYYATGNRLLSQDRVDSGRSLQALAMAPRDDGVVALTSEGLVFWDFDPRHPEASHETIFQRVWYEGYRDPQHVWQSSSGTDNFEPKYGLMPLIFGTIKATLYSMLIGAPLALLAAVYTSEFLHPRVRSRIKPTIELMASLPSVVLGFLAALVIAPFIEGIVPEVLTSLATIPFTLLASAYLWQLWPQGLYGRLERFKFPVMLATLPVGLLLGFALGPGVEQALFAGDIKGWLDGQVGTGTGGWLIALLPVSGLVAALTVAPALNGWMRQVGSSWSRFRFALVDLAKFLLIATTTVLLAWGLSLFVNGLGWDARGSFLDTYSQRNALVVGFVMGFAIIPIIYTIAEDALSAVPDHLRAASLGAGATRWQTAGRIVMPIAMSGLFSAVMIGLGRAVGETMIVLMAAGNTPILEWNIFSGFRTLSANIAVELPEAAVGSTHYRMLFLAALVLFAMTFALNTVAELVRQRYRKRAFEL